MNKMGYDFAGDSLKWISIEKHAFLFIFAMDFVPSGPVDIASALKHALVWCKSGDKSSIERMIIHFSDAYILFHI